MSKTDTGLEKVQSLYIMQIQLLDILDADLSDPRARKQVRDQLKEFQDLLDKADHRYMGGEDVLESLKRIPMEVSEKLKERAVAVRKVSGRRKK